MKFPNSQILNFAKKRLRIIYTNVTVDTYQQLSKYYNYMGKTINPTLNLVHGPKGVIFKNLLTFNTKPQNIYLLSQFRKELNDDGNVFLVELLEDLQRQNKITRLGRNLSILDVNFLRKEKIYAKLKYSRSPQYDMVSGGIAAILSGFLGFLICEKFGLELLDSGDFYIAFMYGVFIVFTLRPLVRVINGFNRDKTYLPSYNVISFQPLIHFYTNLIKLIFKFFK